MKKVLRLICFCVSVVLLVGYAAYRSILSKGTHGENFILRLVNNMLDWYTGFLLVGLFFYWGLRK